MAGTFLKLCRVHSIDSGRVQSLQLGSELFDQLRVLVGQRGGRLLVFLLLLLSLLPAHVHSSSRILPRLHAHSADLSHHCVPVLLMQSEHRCKYVGSVVDVVDVLRVVRCEGRRLGEALVAVPEGPEVHACVLLHVARVFGEVVCQVVDSIAEVGHEVVQQHSHAQLKRRTGRQLQPSAHRLQRVRLRQCVLTQLGKESHAVLQEAVGQIRATHEQIVELLAGPLDADTTASTAQHSQLGSAYTRRQTTRSEAAEAHSNRERRRRS